MRSLTSVHSQGALTQGIGTKASITTFTSDCGFTQWRLELHGTYHHKHVTVQVIVIGNNGWARTRRGSGQWSPWTLLTDAGFFLLGLFYDEACPHRALRQGGISAPPNVKKLRSETVNGATVWHLRVKGKSPCDAGYPQTLGCPSRFDVYVDQATHYWVRTISIDRPKRKKDALKVDTHYSGFNEALNIQPPEPLADGVRSGGPFTSPSSNTPGRVAWCGTSTAHVWEWLCGRQVTH